MEKLLLGARNLGPYVAVAVLVPGGTVLALLMWILRRWK
jgi:hypothetical protein